MAERSEILEAMTEAMSEALEPDRPVGYGEICEQVLRAALGAAGVQYMGTVDGEKKAIGIGFPSDLALLRAAGIPTVEPRPKCTPDSEHPNPEGEDGD